MRYGPHVIILGSLWGDRLVFHERGEQGIEHELPGDRRWWRCRTRCGIVYLEADRRERRTSKDSGSFLQRKLGAKIARPCRRCYPS